MQIGREAISMFAELFPGTIDQLNKLTVIRYDYKDTNPQSDKDNCSRPQTKQGGKVSSLC